MCEREREREVERRLSRCIQTETNTRDEKIYICHNFAVAELRKEVALMHTKLPRSLRDEMIKGEEITLCGLQQCQEDILSALAPLHRNVKVRDAVSGEPSRQEAAVCGLQQCRRNVASRCQGAPSGRLSSGGKKRLNALPVCACVQH